jgi:pimeloyl-ACP methyl ester carboxylesterase
VNAHERRVEFDDGAWTTLETWGAGPNVLCIHGMTSSRKSWQRTAGAMELAYAVHAYDQRGHGDSAGIAGPMTFERQVEDCLAVADAIPGGIDTLIGHSWGGAIALLAGLRMNVSRIVAIDPLFHERGTTWEKEWRDELDPIFALDGAERERAVIAYMRGMDELDVQAKIHAMRHMTIEPILAIGRENGADEGRMDLRERIVAYPRPLLVMLAGVESVVDPDDAHFMHEHAGPNVTIRTFRDAGHSLHRTHFDEYMRVLNVFVGSVAP